MDEEARRLIAEFDDQDARPRHAHRHALGGNIQKLLLARELAIDPKVLVCNKPTTDSICAPHSSSSAPCASKPTPAK